jgi:NAD(P)-dependent dehydrogenase (short-subunit alcohol dehydrogenase family)
MGKVLVTGANKGIGYEIARHISLQSLLASYGIRGEQGRAEHYDKHDGVGI